MSESPVTAMSAELTCRVRVLHCIHSLRNGGAERQLNLLLRDASWRQVEHAVFCVRTEGKLFDEKRTPIFQASRASKWNFRLPGELRAAMRSYHARPFRDSRI